MKARRNQAHALLAYAQLFEKSTIRSGELQKALQLSVHQERELFRRLSKSRLIARVRPGLYLVPPRLPLGGMRSPDEVLALTTLIEDRGGRYQICGPNAFNFYGFDEQIPNSTYAYNNVISGERTIGKAKLRLVEVADERLGSTKMVKINARLTAVYSSRARTLIDAVYDWSRFNGLPRAYRWIQIELDKGNVTAKELVSVALRYGDKSSIRRIGMLLEQLGVDGALLRQLERRVPRTTAFIPWIPTLPKRGTANRRWGVVLNGKL